jgi:hypothetical protein
MDSLDLFFKKFSYKFPKGYPDINNEQDVLLLESILKELGINLNEGNPSSNTKKAIDLLVQKYPDKFEKQSNIYRLGNKAKISPEEFVDIIKKEFNNVNVKISPPGTPPNVKPFGSKKFTLYEFDTEDGLVRILLSGGRGSNLGLEFEDRVYNGLKDAAGEDINDIEDPITVKILDTLDIDPKKLDSENVKLTGGEDTKRPVSFEGPKDRGKTISDISLVYNNTPYYLSIKNVAGSGIYNGGVIPGIVYNKDKTAIEFNSSAYESDEFKSNFLKAFGVDPKKIVEGINNYLTQTGTPTSYEPSTGNLDEVKKLIGSGLDYGYYYIRQLGKDDVKIYNITSSDDTYKLIGEPISIEVKYPGINTKSTTVKVPLKNSALGLNRIEIQIRNASGGEDRPVIKMTVF